MIQLIKHIFPNFFRLGLIQLFSVALQFLLIPIVVSRAGLAENGKWLTALSLSVLFSILINYGTNQSGPLLLSEQQPESEPTTPSGDASDNDRVAAPSAARSSVGLILLMRLLLFVAVGIGFGVFYFLQIDFSFFLLGTLPILLAEVLNPYILCMSTDRLRLLAGLNLIGRLTGFLLVYFGWSGTAGVYWVSAWVGAGLCIVFLAFWTYEAFRGQLRFEWITMTALGQLARTNFSLLLSNLLVHLQQSLVLYSIGAVAGASVLGIYAIIDKLIWGCRMILTSFSGAVFAHALLLYKEGAATWLSYRRKINRLVAGGLLLAAILLLLAAPLLAHELAKGADEIALTLAIRMASLIPLLTGLNLLNVLELILQKKFNQLNRLNFYIFLCVSLLCLALFGIRWSYGEILFWMPVALLFLTETLTLLVYEKNRHYSR